MDPGFRVVSREIGQGFGGCLVVEASQAGSIVVGDEGVEVGVALSVIEEASMVGGAVLRHTVEMLADAAIEALDHAVGLRSEGSGQAVSDSAVVAHDIEGTLTGGLVERSVLSVAGKAVGQ